MGLGCFHSLVIGSQNFVAGIMNVEMYRDVFAKIILPYASAYMGLGFLFQQDSDPKHDSRAIKHLFDRRRVTLMDWPDQSSDPNPIKPFRKELKMTLEDKTARVAAEKFTQFG